MFSDQVNTPTNECFGCGYDLSDCPTRQWCGKLKCDGMGFDCAPLMKRRVTVRCVVSKAMRFEQEFDSLSDAVDFVDIMKSSRQYDPKVTIFTLEEVPADYVRITSSQ